MSVVAILLLGWGTLLLSAWVSTALRDFNAHWARVMIPVALELVTGAGLLFRPRWAWVVGILTSAILVAEGLRRLLFVHVNIEWAVALIYYFAPAIVILVALLPGRARRAFLVE